MKITEQMLLSLGACKQGVARFTDMFPDGMEVTPENCLFALIVDEGKSLWLAGEVFPEVPWNKLVKKACVARVELVAKFCQEVQSLERWGQWART